MYGLRRLQVGRCGELAEGLSSRPTVARVVTREHRCGRGTLQRKVGKRLERRRGSGTRPVSIVTGVEMARLRSKRRGPGICPAQGHRRMARLSSPHQRTARGRDFAQRNRKATPAGAARAARRSGSEFAKRMSSGDARLRHRRSRLAPERGCHEVTGVEMARLRSKRRGSGICPVFKRICPV